MKLIIAVVHNDDAPIVTAELNKAKFHLTKIASTGGFLSNGNTTFLMGVENELVDNAVAIISENSKKRTQFVPTNIYPMLGGISTVEATAQVQTGGATIFVLDVEQFIRV